MVDGKYGIGNIMKIAEVIGYLYAMFISYMESKLAQLNQFCHATNPCLFVFKRSLE